MRQEHSAPLGLWVPKASLNYEHRVPTGLTWWRLLSACRT